MLRPASDPDKPFDASPRSNLLAFEAALQPLVREPQPVVTALDSDRDGRADVYLVDLTGDGDPEVTHDVRTARTLVLLGGPSRFPGGCRPSFSVRHEGGGLIPVDASVRVRPAVGEGDDVLEVNMVEFCVADLAADGMLSVAALLAGDREWRIELPVAVEVWRECRPIGCGESATVEKGQVR